MMLNSSLVSPHKEHGSQSLRKFDGLRIAIVITLGGGSESVLRGTAHYVERSAGNELQIRIPDGEVSGHPTFILLEKSWTGRFMPDTKFGCDLQLRLDVDAAPN